MARPKQDGGKKGFVDLMKDNITPSQLSKMLLKAGIPIQNARDIFEAFKQLKD